MNSFFLLRGLPAAVLFITYHWSHEYEKKGYKKIVNEKQCNLNIEPWTFLVCPQGELTQKILHNSLFLGGPNKENKPPVLLALILLCYLMPEYLHICPNTSITRIE